MWIGSSTDIHEQKLREEELRRANEDLQQFAYSASHDLQEPIRNVAVYSEVVASRYGNALDDQGRLFLSFLREGGHRLSALVSDLLAYTRATMAELSQQPAEARMAVDQALQGLSSLVEETGASIEIGSLPAVRMGGLHLQQLFQNLIGNALKYRSGSAPVISVTAQKFLTEWCFAVKDNGIGIDPIYKEEIFGVFKRLSHERNQGGNGIGLAICQRIVDRYGGRIWVESELGRGATFYFTVPDRKGATGTAAA